MEQQQNTIEIKLDMEGLTPTQQNLLLFLSLESDKNKEIRLTNAELARALGISITTISIALQNLHLKKKISRYFIYDPIIRNKFRRILKIK